MPDMNVHRFPLAQASKGRGYIQSAGFTVRESAGCLTITHVEPCGPAAKAKYLCEGDVLVAIDTGREDHKKKWSTTQLGDHRCAFICACL